MTHSPEVRLKAVSLYQSGLGMRTIAAQIGAAPQSIRRWLIAAGVQPRTLAEGIQLARPRMGKALIGRKRPRSAEWTAKIMASRRANARGTTVKPRGHIEYTVGEHAGRSVHVVMMEQRLGRRLAPDECVHHIDGNPANNEWNNLSLMTHSAHGRIHRLMDKWMGLKRPRASNGKFTK